MIKEQYISYETAKLLKEKGFDWKCIGYYVNDEPNDVKYSFLGETNTTWERRCYSAPTQQMAMRWLREVYKLVICAEIGNENFKGNTDYSNPDRWYWFFDITNEKGVVIDTESGYILNEFDSYEDAVEAAIKYCLTNLI